MTVRTDMPTEARGALAAVEAGTELPVLGGSQDSDLVYDDGEWRVWAVRAAADYGLDPAQVEHRAPTADGRWGFVP